MTFSPNSRANLTQAQARALRLLSNDGVLIAHGCGVFSIGREFFETKTAQALIARGFMIRPRDLFETGEDAGQITELVRAALDWRERRAAA